MSSELDTEFLAHLCRIKLKEEEKKTLDQSLKKIIKYMDMLEETSSEKIEETTLSLPYCNVWEEDEEKPSSFDREIFFQNIPSQVAHMIKIPPVMQFDE